MPLVSVTFRKAPAHTDSSRQVIGSLTGLRFVAALGVVADHYWLAFRQWNVYTGIPADNVPQYGIGDMLIHGGALGVDCFFVLSGFILAYTYVAPAGGLSGSRGAFWAARVARVYPVYLVGLLLDVIPFLGRPHHLGGVVSAVVLSPVLLQAWVPSLGSWSAWDPPGWSLSAEAFFYVLFPFILVVLAKKSSKTLWVAVGLSLAVFAVVPVVLIVLLNVSGANLGWWLDQVLYYVPALRLPEFTLGVATGLLFMRRGPRPEVVMDRQPAIARTDVVIIMLALGIGAALLLPLPQHYPVSVLVLPGFGVLIWLLAAERGVVAYVLSARVSVWLGEMSYAIYILHAPLWAWVAWIGFDLGISPVNPVLLPVYLAVVLVAAQVSYRFVERPLRHAIRGHWVAWESRHPWTGKHGLVLQSPEVDR